ncbi:hypothetical protein Sgly_0341 [Syntrophobotulus glycolicus DSM 8271]|uniref:Rho termination factor N-terminal domain-containing protein n=1 Tax=Syntrophobotulus glycolicus (strain DSM 8271 / FlGlyR) TaxID=645991 RepID=F0SXG1_SYNGF|nr:hypothetical protein [Syntrophobotulus glycolicus]ADY54707.1 hypothetical protein Sgly_0341 [Syntrophobotulus glycolicus DSM 8271]
MLIAKDGISREIDKSRLQEYRNKGYVPVEAQEQVKERPLEKKNVEELKAYATENGIDISEAKNKTEILAILLSSEEKKGE